MIAVCPGSFDPVTVGHLDIIKRAAKMFSQVIVVVLTNPKKQGLFSISERVELVRAVLKDEGIENVSVDSYDGLLADYVKQKDAKVIVKGLRALSDFEYEFQMALVNKKLNPDVETVFITTALKNMYLSSSIVKELSEFDCDISEFVPRVISDKIKSRLNKKGE